jgi:hypothetical protein
VRTLARLVGRDLLKGSGGMRRLTTACPTVAVDCVQVPRSCQCLLMSATTSADLERLQALVRIALSLGHIRWSLCLTSHIRHAEVLARTAALGVIMQRQLLGAPKHLPVETHTLLS